jgi:hypothetical protein
LLNFAHFFGGKFQHGPQQTDFPNRELRRVHAHGNAADASGLVVAEQRALPAFVEFSPAVQGERTGRNDEAFEQPGANFISPLSPSFIAADVSPL